MCASVRPPSVLTSRNNCDPSPDWQAECTPLRKPRPYVKACGTATLALSYREKVAFAALTCKSWSCPHCRTARAASLLDRLRRGMESRPDMNRMMLTLTVDPQRFGALRVGAAYWNNKGERCGPVGAVRKTALWSGPNTGAFEDVSAEMSREWKKLNDRLKRKAARADLEVPGYFRVIELHRNGWPHYHVVLEHSTWTANDIRQQVEGWGLGIVHLADVNLDDAVGEVAPYLVTTEKANGHKAYQFAALALPENFRLHSSSQGFLAPREEPEELPQHAAVLKGHFRLHHEGAKEYGADSRIVCPPPAPPDKPHKPPPGAVATGDGARLYLGTQIDLGASLPAFDLAPDDLPF